MRRALPWFPVSVDLPDHRKVDQLAFLLERNTTEALGYLVRLWAWFARCQPTGVLSAETPRNRRGTSAELPMQPRGASTVKVLERQLEWAGEEGRLVSALIDSGLLDALKDGSLAVHDWKEHAGKLIEKAEKERARKRTSEDGKSASRTSESSAETPRNRRGTSAELPRNFRAETETETERETEKDLLPPPTSSWTPEQTAAAAAIDVDRLWEKLQELRGKARVLTSPDGLTTQTLPLDRENARPRKWAEWTRAAAATLRVDVEYRLAVAYVRWLRDDAFARKVWPTQVFMDPNVWPGRVPAPLPERQTPEFSDLKPLAQGAEGDDQA